MKPQRALVAERQLARHCPELLRAVPPPEEPLPAMDALAARLAPALALQLCAVGGGERPEVTASPARTCSPDDLVFDFPSLAACSLFSLGAGGAPLLVAVEAQAIFRLVDRAFGGSGAAPEPLPPRFPLSADLMIARLESAFAQAMGAASGMEIALCRADHSLDRLRAFDGAESLVHCAFTIGDAAGAWRVVMAAPQSLAEALTGKEARVPRAAKESASAKDLLAGAMGEMPLPLRAVVVDMSMPVSALAALVPGQVVPVSVARNVPLTLGGKTVALGTIGAQDDRVAVQITQVFTKDPQ